MKHLKTGLILIMFLFPALKCASFPLKDEPEYNFFPTSADFAEWSISENPVSADIPGDKEWEIIREYGIDSGYFSKYIKNDSEITYSVFNVGKSYYSYSIAHRMISGNHNTTLRYFSDSTRAIFYRDNYLIIIRSSVPYENFTKDCADISIFLKDRVGERPIPGNIASLYSNGYYPVFYPGNHPSFIGIRDYYRVNYAFNEYQREVVYLIHNDVYSASAIFDKVLKSAAGSVLTESASDRMFYIKSKDGYDVFANSGNFIVLVRGSPSFEEGKKNVTILLQRLTVSGKEKY